VLFFFLISNEVHLHLVGVSFKLVRMASVKQFPVELMLFTVGMGRGRWRRGDVVTL
jgi:hypothetical protein